MTKEQALRKIILEAYDLHEKTEQLDDADEKALFYELVGFIRGISKIIEHE